MPTIKDCLAHCARDARCVSVTHHPASSHCWLKFKQFGDRTSPLEGYNSANLGITGDVQLQITNFLRYHGYHQSKTFLCSFILLELTVDIYPIRIRITFLSFSHILPLLSRLLLKMLIRSYFPIPIVNFPTS